MRHRPAGCVGSRVDVDLQVLANSDGAQAQVQNAELPLHALYGDFLVSLHLQEKTVGDVVLPHCGRLAPYLAHHLFVGQGALLNKVGDVLRFFGWFPFLDSGNVAIAQKRADIFAGVDKDIRDSFK